MHASVRPNLERAILLLVERFSLMVRYATAPIPCRPSRFEGFVTGAALCVEEIEEFLAALLCWPCTKGMSPPAAPGLTPRF